MYIKRLLIFSIAFSAIMFVAAETVNAVSVSINGAEVVLGASTGVTVNASVNNTASNATVTGISGAYHGKGNLAYAMDSDGGGMYTQTLSEGTAALPTLGGAPTTGDDLTTTAWSTIQ